MIKKDDELEFGEWLKRKRKIANFSQEELADASGCSKQYISFLELGGINPKSGRRGNIKLPILDAMANALGLSRDEMRIKAGYAPEDVRVIRAGAISPDGEEGPVTREDFMKLYRGLMNLQKKVGGIDILVKMARKRRAAECKIRMHVRKNIRRA